VWQSADPALGGYLNATKADFQAPALANNWHSNLDGLGIGGMFDPTNLNSFAYAGNQPLNLLDPDGMAKARSWQSAERQVKAKLQRQGHTIISTQQAGQTIYANRKGDWYIWGRKFDVISRDAKGRYYLTEVKWRKNPGKQRSLARKVLRRFDPSRKPKQVKRVGEAVGMIRQLHFDVYLTSDITLSGGQMGTGRMFSEMGEDNNVDIRYEFWSAKKNEIVIPISQIKRMGDPKLGKQEREKLGEKIMEYYTVQ
jgi:hypothetical protein